MRLSPLYWYQLDVRAPNRQIRLVVDRDVWPEGAQFPDFEAVAEERPREYLGRRELDGNLFLVVAAGIELHVWVEAPEVAVAPDVIPVGMCDQDRGQRRQPARVSTQGFIGRLGRIGPRARVDADQFAPILRDHE